MYASARTYSLTHQNGVLVDKDTGAKVVKIHPGDHYVTREKDEMLVTVLGSCVAACIRDPIAGVGGMNHFMLPSSEGNTWGGASSSLRYGNYAMEALINDILKHGGAKNRLEIKVFGGGRILSDALGVGSRNAQFVLDYLRNEGLSAVSSSLEGASARRVHYYPVIGKAFQKFVSMEREKQLVAEEKTFSKTIVQKPVEGDIELF